MKLAVSTFIKDEFPSLELDNPSLEQLVERVDGNTSVNTPEKAMVDTTHPDFIQIKRIGGRLNALDLLLKDDYEGFIAEQAAHMGAYNQVLSREEFDTTRARFQDKDDLFIQTLKVSTIVGGVNLANPVKARAQEFGVDFTNDSVQGMADLFADIEKAKKIFPLVKHHFDQYDKKDHPRITRLFQAAFSQNTHLRHMLYTECNQNGFRDILSRMQNGKLDKEGLEFTANYWLTDIFGFRANISGKGSIYYTHNTHKAFEALYSQLNKGLTQASVSAKAMFEGYLQQRAQWLGLDVPELTKNDQMLLAHLGSMMRLFSADHGALLAAGLKLIPSKLRALSDVYFEDTDPSEPTPTYVPALFANAIDCRKEYYMEYAPKQILEALPPIQQKDNELRDLMATMDATALFLSFYLKTIQLYRAKRANGELDDMRAPLSYRNFAFKPNIEKLFKSHPIFREHSPFDRQFNPFDAIEPVINHDGSVSHSLKGNSLLLRFTNGCYLKLEQLKKWYNGPSQQHQSGLFNLFGLLRTNSQSCAEQPQQQAPLATRERKAKRGV